MERIELHLHTTMSEMDGINECEDYIEKAKRHGMTALAITDHASVQAFPQAQKYLEKITDNKFKILYGMEGYYSPSNDINGKIYHISILVKNKTGLKNLYKIVSISNLGYFYKKPIILKKVLEENHEGLIIGSACSRGEIYQAIIENKIDEELEQIAKEYDYLEIQPIGNNYDLIRNCSVKDKKTLKDINIKIVEIGTKLNKLVVATSDVHFINKKDKIYRQILMVAKDYEYAEADAGEQAPLYFRTTKEMLNEFKYLGQDKAYEVVVTNTNKIADMCEKVKPISDEKCYPYIEKSEIEIRELAYKGAYNLYGNPLPTKVEERLKKELDSIIKNNFATQYIIARKLVKKSNDDGYIVESRCDSASSLVAYCVGITEVDPIKYNIPFETFAGFNGDKDLDIDLKFATEYQIKAKEYLKTIIGEENVFNAGTIKIIGNITAYKYVKKYFEKRKIQVDINEMVRISQGIIGIKKMTKQQSCGVIIVPKGREIYDFCPIQYGDDDSIITHFDYHAIEKKLLKLDIIRSDALTMLHRLQELTGVKPSTINLEDKETMKLFATADTLGIPMFETGYVREMLASTNPTTFGELISINGLSHSTNGWLNNARDLIKNGTATLKEVIACRDDIMNDLIEVGIEPKIAFEIMEIVRKGKVRKIKREDWEGYKEIMESYNIPKWYIESCEKILYLIPKALMTSYTINAFRIAWYKVHYPKAFYKTCLEVKDD